MKKYVDEEVLESLIDRLEEVENKMTSIENCYPIGSIYISMNNTNPGTTFGFGTWTQIQDRFLLAAGSTYTGGSTGGAATVALSKTQVPNVNGNIHLHAQTIATDVHNVTGCFSSLHTNEDSYVTGSDGVAIIKTGANSIGVINFDNGGTGAAHNNMPPYLTVYIWQRTS